MPDESTYGFNRADASELVNLIGNSDQEFPELKPEFGKCRAKWIKFAYEVGGGSNATPTVTDYWDGGDPTNCGTVNVEYPLGEPCTDSNVIAFYDQNTDTYQAIATPNAIQGLPETKDVLITGLTSSTTCGIGWTEQSMKVITCGTTPATDSVTLQNTALGVVTSVVDTGTAIAITYRDIYVCGYTAASTANIATTECAPPCTGNCQWKWSYVSQSWALETACASGCDCGSAPPAPANGSEPSSHNMLSALIPCNSTSYTYDESGKFALVTGLGT